MASSPGSAGGTVFEPIEGAAPRLLIAVKDIEEVVLRRV